MKLDLILENIRNGYTLNLLEESASIGTVPETEILKGKMLINESTMMIRKMLVEEGVMQDVKAILHDNFKAIIEESIFGWEPATEEQINSDNSANIRDSERNALGGKSVAEWGNALGGVIRNAADVASTGARHAANGFNYVNSGQANADAHNALNQAQENMEARANGVAYKNAAEGLVNTVSQPGAALGIQADGLANRVGVSAPVLAGAAGLGAAGLGALGSRMLMRRPATR